jgi:non-ribosomal peptide synthetase component F
MGKSTISPTGEPPPPASCQCLSVEAFRRVADGVHLVRCRLAVWLQANGAGPDKIVPIYMGRQIEYVVAYIAILKACAAYLPMDVAYPMDLVGMVLDDSEPCCMLLTPDYLANIKGRDMPTFVFDAGWEERLPPPGSKPVRPADMTWDNMAYCVYSSGTTGQPKGICCPHKGSVLSYGWRSARYPYGPGVEREGCNVFFVWEMLRPLLNGQECWVIPDTVIFDVQKLPLFISEHKITRMLFTPSLLEAMLGEPGMDSALYNSMRLIVLCGEVLMRLTEALLVSFILVIDASGRAGPRALSRQSNPARYLN